MTSPATLPPTPAGPAPAGPPAPARPAPVLWRRRLRRNWLTFGAAAVVLLMLLAAVFADWVAPFGPDTPDAAASPFEFGFGGF